MAHKEPHTDRCEPHVDHSPDPRVAICEPCVALCEPRWDSGTDEPRVARSDPCVAQVFLQCRLLFPVGYLSYSQLDDKYPIGDSNHIPGDNGKVLKMKLLSNIPLEIINIFNGIINISSSEIMNIPIGNFCNVLLEIINIYCVG